MLVPAWQSGGLFMGYQTVTDTEHLVQTVQTQACICALSLTQ